MTIASTSIRTDYAGTGIAGPFTFSFCVFNISNLRLIVTKVSTGSSADLVINDDYTVVGIKAPTDYTEGGTITLTDILSSGYKLSIISNLDGTQITSIRNNAEYYAVLHENEFDKLALEDLQNKEQISKSVKAPDSEPAGATTLDLPTAYIRANKTIVFDEDGNLGVQPPEGAVGPQGPAGPAYVPYVYTMVAPVINGTINNYSPVDTAGKDFADGNVTELGIVTSEVVNITGINSESRTIDTDLLLFNVIGGTITLKSKNTESLAINRFNIPSDVVIPENGWAMIRFINTPAGTSLYKGWLVTSTGLYA
jgi:hypothetical protein